MILPPTNCPSCDYALESSNDILYCRNPDCGASGQKRVEHFAKTLKIKGLGPAAIEKLDIDSIEQIYELSIEYITLRLKSAKLAVKLFEEIRNSEKQPLNTVLPAFGIPLIGKTASDKLSKVCDSIFDIDVATCKEAGLGDKATQNLTEWLDKKFDDYSHLPFSFEFEKVRRTSSEDNKGVICITGKLSSFKTKAEAAVILEGLGYVIKDKYTKDVTILVNESGKETASTIKAADAGCRIIENLKDFIGEED